MDSLYRMAIQAWGACTPEPLRRLQIRDDEHTLNALRDVLHDVTSPTWTVDAKIAWRLMNRGDNE